MSGARHRLAEDGACERCRVAYPWPSPECRAGRARSSTPFRHPHKSIVTPEWMRVEIETRAALGTTPLSRDEIIDRVLELRIPQRKEQPRPDRIGTCTTCGSEFRHRTSRRKTCSQACYDEARNAGRRAYYALKLGRRGKGVGRIQAPDSGSGVA